MAYPFLPWGSDGVGTEGGAEVAAMFPGPRQGSVLGVPWAQWREGGNDTDSLWLDPLFR